jgi:hypothetical protein
MSVNPIGGVGSLSALQQPTAAQATVPGSATATATAAQVSPRVDAAQAWEDAMRAAMGDESSSDSSASDPLASLALESPASSPLAAQTTATTSTTSALTPQALAALVSGGTTGPTDPLITSLSAQTDAPTPTSDAAAGSFV